MAPDLPQTPFPLNPPAGFADLSSDSEQGYDGNQTSINAQTPKRRVRTSTPRPPERLARVRRLTNVKEIMNFAPDVNLLRRIAPALFESMVMILNMPFAFRLLDGRRMHCHMRPLALALILNI